MDLVQNALNEGMLKFVDKQKPRVEEDVDPKFEETLLVDPMEVLMVNITNHTDQQEVETNYEDHMKVIFPKNGQELINFLNRCRLKDSEIMFFLCYSVVFNKEVAKELEKVNPYQSKRRV